jgi:hypothetical protein
MGRPFFRALGFAAFVIGHVVVLWKMDWGYGRR